MTRAKKDDEECCDMRGMLSFLVLFILSKKSLNGQEIADEIKKRKGDRPSPGTIYPALKSLKEAGFIKEHGKEKGISYALSAKGKKVLKLAKRKFCQAFKDIM